MSIDYSQIPPPTYQFGNSSEIHQALLTSLHQEATHPTLSNFIHLNNNLGQTISTPLLFNVTGDDDDETHLRLAKKGWVKNRIAKLVLDTDNTYTNNNTHTGYDIFNDIRCPTDGTLLNSLTRKEYVDTAVS